ncbi:MAG: chaperone modulator CbpM [Sulfuricella sp.]
MNEILTGVVVDETGTLTLAEFACACGAEATWVLELVAEEVLHPTGGDPEGWRFGGRELTRARRFQRLQRDLGANLDAVAVILELLDEIDRLKGRLRRAGLE